MGKNICIWLIFISIRCGLVSRQNLDERGTGVIGQQHQCNEGHIISGCYQIIDIYTLDQWVQVGKTAAFTGYRQLDAVINQW